MSQKHKTHISCNYKCKFNGIKCNSNQKWNTELCRHECKNPIKHRASEKDYIFNPSTCPCEIDEYLKSIIGDSVVAYDEIIRPTKNLAINVSHTIDNC